MRQLKLSVTSGGLDGFSKHMNIDAYSHFGKKMAEKMVGDVEGKEKLLSQRIKEQGTIKLVSRTALIGMVARLCGEEVRVHEILSSKDDFSMSIQEVCDSAMFSVVKKPWLEGFSARYREGLVKAQNAPIGMMTIYDCYAWNSFFAKEIEEIYGTRNAGEIYDITWGTKDGAIEPTVPNQPILRLTNLISDFEALVGNYVIEKNGKKDPTKFITENVKNMKLAISEFYKNEASCVKVGETQYSEHTIKFLEKVSEVLKYNVDNQEFKSKFLESNSFGFLQKTNKSWAPDSVPFATSDHTICLKFDFDIYLEVTEEIFARIINGPQDAYFGHKGIVTVTQIEEFEKPSRLEKELLLIVSAKAIKGFEDVKINYKDMTSTNYEYTFTSSKKKVGAYDCHALFTHLFDKNKVDQGSVAKIGENEILVKSHINLSKPDGFKVSIKDGINTHVLTLKKTEKKVLGVSVGESEKKKSSTNKYSFSSLISCTVKENGREMPLFTREGEVREHLLVKHFRDNGMKLTLESAREEHVAAFGKVRFKNVAQIEGVVEIIDTQRAAKALALGLGQKKTYGFGLLKLENEVTESKKMGLKAA